MSAHGEHTTPRPVRRVLNLLKLDGRDYRTLVVYAVCVGILSLVTPVAVESLTSTVMYGVVLWPIIWLALIMLGCLAMAAVVHAAEESLVELLQQRMFVRITEEIARKLLHIRLTTFDTEPGQHFANRFFDVFNLQKAASSLLLEGIGMLITILVGMVVLAVYHPLLLAFAGGLIVLMVMLVLLGYGGIASSIDESAQKYTLAEWLQEIGRRPHTFRTATGPRFALDHTDTLATDYVLARQAHFRIVFRQILFGLLMQVVTSVFLLSLGGYLVIKQQLTLGQLVAAELIVTVVVGYFSKIGKYVSTWYDLCTALEKIAHVTEAHTDRTSGELLPTSARGMALTWNDIQITPGERVAVYGGPGSGKSHLLQILAGLREPDAGIWTVDGFLRANIQLDSLREQVIYLAEGEPLVGSVRENLTLGADISLDRVQAALRAMQIDHLADGFETLLTASGAPLSEQQCVRLALARGLTLQPRLIVIDGLFDRLGDADRIAALAPFLALADSVTVIVATTSLTFAREFPRQIAIDSNPR